MKIINQELNIALYVADAVMYLPKEFRRCIANKNYAVQRFGEYVIIDANRNVNDFKKVDLYRLYMSRQYDVMRTIKTVGEC